MDAVAEQVAALSWYHTIELRPGLVTDGWWDHRPYVHRFGLPERLDGLRVLDIGTWDGFWAFEMERRGAAEVLAIDLDDEADLDWPPRRRPAVFPERPRGTGFRLAKEVLGSSVERVNLSIYDATAERLGTFDLVFCASVVMHLRDQFLALERVAGLCRDLFISTEEYDAVASLLPWPMSRYYADRDKAVVYWLPAVRTWRRMLWSVGFERVTEQDRFRMRPRPRNFAVRHVVHHARKSA